MSSPTLYECVEAMVLLEGGGGSGSGEGWWRVVQIDFVKGGLHGHG